MTMRAADRTVGGRMARLRPADARSATVPASTPAAGPAGFDPVGLVLPVVIVLAAGALTFGAVLIVRSRG